MQHLDEGTIHALLDGELAGAEGTEVLAHVESCEICSARLSEERQIQAEAERMILELDQPAPRVERPMAGAPFTTDEPFVLPPPPSDQLVRQGAPIVLVPDRDTERVRIPLRFLAAAAMLVVAVGAGFLALRSGSDGRPAARGPEVLTDAPVTITLPPLDATARESAASLAAGDSVSAPRADSGAAAGAALADRAVAESVPAAAVRAQAEDEVSRKAREPEPVPAAPVREERARAAETDQAPPQGRAQASVSRQAAGESPAAAPAPASAPPAARRPVLEQEAQITMRVGLDEAQRMLGGPVHVIDGLRPEFMGLVEGRLVPGADPNSYVVRVVYLDDNRRALFLDQQRLDSSRRLAGAARDTTPPDWVRGDVRLSLKGSMTPAELRALAERVR